MCGHNIQGRQLTVWSLIAVTAPLAQLAGGVSWIVTVISGVLGGTVLLAAQAARWKLREIPRWFLVPAGIWILLKIIYILNVAEECWQTDDSKFFVPLVLLALGAWSASKGAAKAACVAAILAWIIAGGYGSVVAAAVPKLKVSWMFQGGKEYCPEILIAFLLPLAAMLLPCEKKPISILWVVIAAVTGMIFSFVINGVMTAEIAAQYQNGFYEMSRSLSFLGIAKRFESVVAAVMVLGWFSVLAMYFSAAEEIGKCALKEKGNIVTASIAISAAAIYLIGGTVPAEAVLIGDAVLCLLLFSGAAGTEKRLKKREKRG